MRNLLAGLFSAFVLAVHAAPVVTPTPLTANGALSQPVEIAHAGDGSNRLFIVERAGRIRIFANGAMVATPFLDLTATGRILSTDSEQGLLGLTFHPNYVNNGIFYVFYTSQNQGPIVQGSLVVASYSRNGSDPNLGDPTTQQVIIAIPHGLNNNHNGGKIAFGPDGHLYVGTGDGGGGGDLQRNGQNRGQLLGKILRLQVDGRSAGYTIPSTNPYATQSCTANLCPEIWAYGLRNPWKFSFDRATGDLLIGDVGQGAREEVDFQPAGAGGRNYGWGIFEGSNCYNDTYFGPAGACAGLSNHTLPVIQYNHDASGGFSITGGYRFRGLSSAALRGYYLYGDFGSARVWAARPDTSGNWLAEQVIAPGTVSGISSFGEDEFGELYLLDYNNGRLYSLKGPAPAHVPDTDFSGEGRSDLLFVDASQQAGAWLMNGVTPLDSALFLSRTSGWNPIITRSDFNADGRSDIVWRHDDGSVALWLMNGLGTVDSALLTGPGSGWGVTHIGDFNGDGRSDLVWKHTDGSVSIWLMNGTALVSGGIVFGPGTEWIVSHIADLDGDGRSDLVWKNGDGSVSIWLMNGLATTGSNVLFGPGNPWSIYFASDFDGDLRADLLMQHSDGSWALWLMDGLAPLTGAIVLGPGTGWSASHAADFDGDGRTDILWRHADESVAAWLMNGLVPTSGAVLFGGGSGWRVTHVRDLNGDGRGDLVWHHAVFNYTAVWLMNGLAVGGSAVVYGGSGSWGVAP